LDERNIRLDHRLEEPPLFEKAVVLRVANIRQVGMQDQQEMALRHDTLLRQKGQGKIVANPRSSMLALIGPIRPISPIGPIQIRARAAHRTAAGANSSSICWASAFQPKRASSFCRPASPTTLRSSGS